MRLTFLTRAFAAPLALGILVAFLVATKEGPALGWPGFLLLLCLGPLAWYFTDLWLTGRVGARPRPTHAPNPLVRCRTDDLWPAIDRRRKRDAAIASMQRFYRRHRALLASSFPPAMFDALLHTLCDTEPLQCWQKAQEFFVKLCPLVAEGQSAQADEERRDRSREARRTQIDREIAAVEADMNKLKESPLGKDAVVEEILGCQRKIKELRYQLQILDDANTDGGVL